MRFLRTLRAACFVAVAGIAVPLLTIAAPSAAEGVSLVYVDFDKIVSDVDEGQNAQDAMKKEQVKRQTDIQAMEAKIKKLQDELEKQAKTLSGAALEKKAAEYQQALGDYQQIVLKFNNELQAKERELFDPIERRLRDLLRSVAIRDGYDMILTKRSIAYGRKDLDLTDKVIQEYNKAYPAKKVAPAASATTSAKKPDVKPAPTVSTAPKMK